LILVVVAAVVAVIAVVMGQTRQTALSQSGICKLSPKRLPLMRLSTDSARILNVLLTEQ
jgi:hypothetical protein